MRATMPDVRTGDVVRLNGHIGRVVNHWRDADKARRRDDDGLRVALVLEDGSLLANVRASDVRPLE